MAGTVVARLGSRALQVAVSLMWLATPSLAEHAWVKDDLRLNLRAGPGLEFQTLGVIKTGDDVDVLERTPRWTRVEVTRIGNGWIPVGYLQTDPPARLLLTRREIETAELREKVARLAANSEKLESANRSLAERDESRTQQIERLARENRALRVKPRWPEWIAGASILGVGMIFGSLLQRNTVRRHSPRIRL